MAGVDDGDARLTGVEGLGEPNPPVVKDGVAFISEDNGNLIGLTSSYQTTDGASHAAADVWFVADRNQDVPVAAPAADLRSQVSSMAQALSTYAAADPVAAPAATAAPPAATVAAAALAGIFVGRHGDGL